MKGRFDYIEYDAISAKAQAEMKKLCEQMEAVLNAAVMVHNSETARYRALALTHLEECYAFAGKLVRDAQIARTGGAVLHEQRGNS